MERRARACAVHPEVPATAACVVCARPACVACLQDVAALRGSACPSCRAAADRLGSDTAAPPQRSGPRSAAASRIRLVGRALGVVVFVCSLALFGTRWQSSAPSRSIRRTAQALTEAQRSILGARHRDGHWPTSADRPDGEPLPVDPMDPEGRPLRWVPHPASERRLWSVGPDGVDDGGRPIDALGRGDWVVPLR